MIRKTVRIIMVVLTLSVIAVGGLLVYRITDQNDARAETQASAVIENIIPVEVITTEATTIRDVLVLPGETMPSQDVRLSAEQGGRVEWIGPKEGDFVKKGDLLIKIDYKTLKAQYDRAQAAYQLACKNYDRRRILYESRIVAKEELDRAKTECSVQLGELEQVKALYHQAFIRAPIDGIVNRLFVDTAEFVGRGDPLVDLVNPDIIEVELNVPELDVKYFQPGQKTIIRADAYPERDFEGVIDFISYKANSVSKTFRAKILVDNQERLIRPGMMVRSYMLRQIFDRAVIAPLFALLDKGGERILFVEKDGVAQSRVVTLGVIDGDRIQVLEGLEPGENLIVTGQTEVADGMRVVVK